MSLQQVLSVLEQYPALSTVRFDGLTLFLRMACLARPLIESQETDKRHPPAYLHPGLLELLGGSLSEPDLDIVQLCWAAFKDIIWSHPAVEPTENEILQYNKAALCRAFHHFFPPVRVCQVSGCINHRDSDDTMTLTEPMTHKATLYTLRNGALPVYTTSLHCRGKFPHRIIVEILLSQR
ncbi:hypothetical protein B0H13DRAFT_1601503 [Mycena leptocephala]|nr:hypothetical protein B0H13DRAFT_1601503 [Mycena leptocephala]